MGALAITKDTLVPLGAAGLALWIGWLGRGWLNEREVRLAEKIAAVDVRVGDLSYQAAGIAAKIDAASAELMRKLDDVGRRVAAVEAESRETRLLAWTVVDQRTWTKLLSLANPAMAVPESQR